MAKKTVQVNVTVDDFDLADLDQMVERVEKVFEAYEFRRVDVSIRDTPIIRPTPGVLR